MVILSASLTLVMPINLGRYLLEVVGISGWPSDAVIVLLQLIPKPNTQYTNLADTLGFCCIKLGGDFINHLVLLPLRLAHPFSNLCWPMQAASVMLETMIA